MYKTQGGQYAFSVRLNNKVKAHAMLESGIHVMLIDSAFLFSHLDQLQINPVPCEQTEKMNLGGHIYLITHKAQSEIAVSSDVYYKGEIFVLSNYAVEYEVALPIQNLHHLSSHRRIAKLDLSQNLLEILPKKDISMKEWQKVKMNTRTYLSMPAIQTELLVQMKDGVTPLQGNFNLDLGNASFLFLFEQNKNVQEWLGTNSQLTLQEARNRQGIVIAKAFVPKECRLVGMDFTEQAIAVTGSLPRFTALGDIGLKFFLNVVVVFDFERGSFYFKSGIKDTIERR